LEAKSPAINAQMKKTTTAMGKVHTNAGPAFSSPRPNPEYTAVVALMTENPMQNDAKRPMDLSSRWS
jgi:hypothetical protein